jgi:hypothetical protein
MNSVDLDAEPINDSLKSTGIVPGRIVVPDGHALGYFNKATPAEVKDLPTLNEDFLRRANHFGNFFEIANSGQLLNRLLMLANSRSFIDQAMRAVADDAIFKNGMVELFEGHHTNWRSMSLYLSWASIYIDTFTSTPIPENLQLIAEGRDSLREVAENHRNLYDYCQRGVIKGKISQESVLAAGVKVTLLVDGQPIAPQMISDTSSTIIEGDNVYYNGLPGDRARFPTFVVPEGSRISLKFENTTDQPLSIVPTINGIPLAIDHLYFSLKGFERSSFPILEVDPHSFTINPGESETILSFRCNNSAIVKERKKFAGRSSSDNIEHGPDLMLLAPLVRRILDRSITAGEAKILDQLDEAFRDQILIESAVSFAKDFLSDLAKARKTDIFVRAPIIADGIKSSELSNPLVGSIGVSVIRLETPPVKAQHGWNSSASSESYSMGSDIVRGMGSSGLASIGGGSDMHSNRMASSLLSGIDKVHRYVGYAPINLMSAAKRAK